MKIQEIQFQETFPVRHRVLRQGKPIESCFFDGDDNESTVHFGLFDQQECIGVASIFKNKNASFKNDVQYQLRGMAVLEHFQKKGFGEQLVKYIEDHIQLKEATLLWFNARVTAVAFYEKLGFVKRGAAFDIPDVGMHYLMAKEYKQH
jgi:GNAT superfamily N-acetyltransferase